MNWTHFALATYVFILAAILLLIGRRLFQPAASRETASNPLDTAFDQALLEHIARLSQQADASRNNEDRLAWNEAMAPVLRGSAVERPCLERNITGKPSLARIAPEKPVLEKPSPIRLNRSAAGSIARLAIAPERQRTPETLFNRRMEQENQAAGGEQLDGEPDVIRSVRMLIAEGLDDDFIADRMRLSLAEIGLVRRLPAIAPTPSGAPVPAASPLDAGDVPASAKRPRGRPKENLPASERVRKTRIKENRKTFENNNRVLAPTTAELPAIAGNRR